MTKHKHSRLEDFRRYRENMNQRILATGNLDTKRFFGLDSRVYQTGELPESTKELLGLCASMALRCDDCIAYHVIRCCENDLSRPQIMETLNIALVVGGSIVIPHFRRAVELLDDILGEEPDSPDGDS